MWSTKYEGVVHWIGMSGALDRNVDVVHREKVYCIREGGEVRSSEMCGSLDREVWCTGEGGVVHWIEICCELVKKMRCTGERGVVHCMDREVGCTG